MFEIFRTIWYAYQQSDGAGKIIVLILLVLSSVSWGILIDRFFLLRPMLQSTRNFLHKYSELHSPLMMYSQLSSYDGILADLCKSGMDAVFNLMSPDETARRQMLRHNFLPRTLEPLEVERVRSIMYDAESRLTENLEGHQMVLGSIVSLSPFLGLFGTVWGVMATFIGIAKAGRPDLMAIAPGISGALLTTVAGLLVAIPALLANNFIQSSVHSLNQEMDNFIEDFLTNLPLMTKAENLPLSRPQVQEQPRRQAPEAQPDYSYSRPAPAERPKMPRSSFDNDNPAANSGYQGYNATERSQGYNATERSQGYNATERHQEDNY